MSFARRGARGGRLKALFLVVLALALSSTSFSLQGKTAASRWSRHKKSSSLLGAHDSNQRSTSNGFGGTEALDDTSGESAIEDGLGVGLRRRKRRRIKTGASETSSRSSFLKGYEHSSSSGFRRQGVRGDTSSLLDIDHGQDSSDWESRKRQVGASRITGTKGTAGDELDNLIDELSSTSAAMSKLSGARSVSRGKGTVESENSLRADKYSTSTVDSSAMSGSSLTYKLKQPSAASRSDSDSSITKEKHYIQAEEDDVDFSSKRKGTGLSAAGTRTHDGGVGKLAYPAGETRSKSVSDEEDLQSAGSAMKGLDDGVDDSGSGQKTSPTLKKKISFSEESFSDLASQASAVTLPELTSEQGPKSKNAYVSFLYTGTRRDFEYFIGLRVTLQTLKWTRTAADLVVLASSNVPNSWRNTLLDDGARVVLTPNVGNPYNTSRVYNTRFRFVLNKLMAWRLTEYTRVVLLDADNLVLKNMDELFLCGDFCAVFINPCIFHTGLIVLKPSTKKLRRMMRSLTKLPSFDGADQGFLQSFFPGLLASPLFEQPPNKTLSKSALRPLRGQYRLPMGYQMDAIYFNLKSKWNVPCSDNKVITFPGVSALKPWYWWSWPLFTLSMQWHMTRLASIGYPWEFGVCLGFGILWGVLLVSTYLKALVACLCPQRREKGGSPDSPKRSNMCCGIRLPSFALLFPRLFNALRQAGSFVWTMLTFASVPAACLVSFTVIPATTHPLVGWPLFLLGTFAMLKSVRTITGAPLSIYWIPAYIVLSLVVLALPIYGSLAFRLAVFHVLAFGGGLVTMLVYQSLSSYGWGKTSKPQEMDRARAE